MFRTLFSKTGLMIVGYLVLGFLVIGGPAQPHDVNGLANLVLYAFKLMIWPVVYFFPGSITLKL
jgi:hypothetical protein